MLFSFTGKVTNFILHWKISQLKMDEVNEKFRIQYNEEFSDFTDHIMLLDSRFVEVYGGMVM
jgi:hypothetical protein